MEIPYSEELNALAANLAINDSSFLLKLEFTLTVHTTTVETKQIQQFKKTAPPLITTIFHGFKSISKASESTSDILTIAPTASSTLKQVTISHEFLTFDQKCQRFLNTQIPTSYETTGPLIRLNLSPSQLPFKHAIGIALLSKATKTVISKIDISAVFRNLNFELIAGVPEYVFTLNQDVRLKIDYEKVYFNSRLIEFHREIAAKVLKTTTGTILDVTAGVGPFSMRLGKTRKVICNDLNPTCFELLKENARLNKIEGMEIRNLNGIQFLQEYKDDKIGCILMNLPELGIELLEGLRGFKSACVVIFECFSRQSDNFQVEIQGKIDEIIQIKDLKCEKVRDVSNGKWMIRGEFILNEGKHDEL
ncbi:tRNA (guanine37-N1)-methyltransferase [Spironucleus salmonicida]|uniref:Met-10+ protein n=1 Tax=Spironucleus salmonicida TaxID=348837 RepID=V6LAL5_9EUKA|nr:tRNA (guanine37-N1)-methyltransferase [Spironucleus salmonicida]|eukprot:EST41500.1 Met-10+ protein [Spironucleus salmonicida]